MSIEVEQKKKDSTRLRALLAERLLKEAEESPSGPLSFAQHRLWFLDQLEPNSPLYNIPSVARLTGKLDIPALEQAINTILARHETLRTRFVNRDGEPAQVVDEEVRIELTPINLSEVPTEQREARMEQVVDEEVKRPFNLSKDCLFRATLIVMGAEEHVLILNIHHIISDEWSLAVFFRELTKLYQSFTEKKPVELPELPIQYTDYAVWQREWLKGEVYEKQLEFWKQQLAGNPTGVELPTDHPRRPATGTRGRVLCRSLSEELAQGLKELANREGVTLFMVLLAAFKTLLHRYTHQTDIIVGSPMAGRNRLETENLIGFFVNTLPLRTKISGDPSFLELLAQVREVALGAYSHQDMPFEKLVEVLQPERSVNQTPFVKVMFLIQNWFEEVRMPGLKVELMDRVTDTAKFELSLGVQEIENGMIAGIEYNAELFEEETVSRFLQHYESLLQGVVANPRQRLSELPLLSEAEKRQLLQPWSPPPANPAESQCLHEWFESQAQRTPDAVAVSYQQSELTYRELNAEANQLAHYLKKLGVGPEIPVALHLERSPKMVVAILGVLKAGGVYVPMDPGYPRDRLSFMLEDTQAPVVLTFENVRATLPITSARIVSLDSDWAAVAKESKENPLPEVGNDNAAYIIYTSGSTGRPKGVIVTHHNVVRLFTQTQAWYQFNETDVWTLFHAYTFDFSVWEIWGALLYGGRLVVVPYMISRSPAEFYQLLSCEKVTVLNQTPSAFRQLVWAESVAPEQLPLKLRYVIFGGEALELQSLQPWFDRHGDQRPQLVNMYGITETTVHVTYRPIRQSDLTSGLGSVIGVPILDLRVLLLDEKLQPVPTGVVGEICVQGEGVARGYLNRPELTSQRFVPDPYSTEAGARLYRSGDLARYTAHGELEYLGRIDHQVKIRGFRVELGEIESALNQHAQIRESVVLAVNGPGGSKRLVAYIVPKGSVPSTTELREVLGKKLPDYMVPAVFVPLDNLPLTRNGKVDRNALPALEDGGNEQNCAPPRNATETTLVEIWSQLLGRKSVSIHENFFQMGGHSLLATQVIWRIAGAFNVDLPVRTIFESPTVAALAEAVENSQPRTTEGIGRRKTEQTKGRKLMAALGQLSDSEGDLQQLLQHKSGEVRS